MATKQPQNRPQSPPMEGAVGASDATNGGGAGSGIPDADTGMRAEEALRKGNPAEDKRKLFGSDKAQKPNIKPDQQRTE
jgi:hypothetical protein